MIRILNFVCFAAAALCCLALYHVSEQTRVSRIHLLKLERQIADEHGTMKVLQADWERVSEPSHIQMLAQTKLGLSDVPAVALASLELRMLMPGHAFTVPPPLFKKIAPEEVADLSVRYGGEEAAEAAT